MKQMILVGPLALFAATACSPETENETEAMGPPLTEAECASDFYDCTCSQQLMHSAFGSGANTPFSGDGDAEISQADIDRLMDVTVAASKRCRPLPDFRTTQED